jgi:hypothetical protein
MCYLTHLCLSLVRIMSQNLSEQSKPDILFSCYSTVSKEGEQFVANHVLSFGLEGSSSLFMNGLHYSSGEGDFRFIKRNQLAKFIKYPSAGGEYKSISVSIDQGTLHALSKEYGIYAEHQFGNEGVVKLEANPLLQNFKSSIIPYLNNSGELNSMIISLKVKEAVLILLQTNPALKDTLFDFSDPGKIDLEAYMTANYKYFILAGVWPRLKGISKEFLAVHLTDGCSKKGYQKLIICFRQKNGKQRRCIQKLALKIYHISLMLLKKRTVLHLQCYTIKHCKICMRRLYVAESNDLQTIRRAYLYWSCEGNIVLQLIRLRKTGFSHNGYWLAFKNSLDLAI